MFWVRNKKINFLLFTYLRALKMILEYGDEELQSLLWWLDAMGVSLIMNKKTKNLSIKL